MYDTLSRKALHNICAARELRVVRQARSRLMTEDPQLLLERFRQNLVCPGAMSRGIRGMIRDTLCAEHVSEGALNGLDQYLRPKARPGMRVLVELSRKERTDFFECLSRDPSPQKEVRKAPIHSRRRGKSVATAMTA